MPSCFVGVLSSHGEQGVIFGSDGLPVKLADIYKNFGGPVMAGKNKLFLVQVRHTTFYVYFFIHMFLSFERNVIAPVYYVST